MRDQQTKPPAMSRRAFLTAAGAVAMASTFSNPTFSKEKPVILGQVQLSFYAVTGGVVQTVLERLGHTVEVREGSHETMFPQLGDGSIDLMAAAWLPEGHAAYWQRYGADAVEVAPLYEGARFFMGVPDYVPADAVRSIADLAKPDVAARMTKLVQGIGPGATITVVANKALADYGLNDLGYSLRPGTAQEWIAAYEAAAAEKRWIAFPTWAPQYLNAGGRIRPLEDPKGILGGENRASLVAPKARFAALPERTRTVLSRIRLSVDAVTEMDRLVNAEKLSPLEAARTWMAAHEAETARWFSI